MLDLLLSHCSEVTAARLVPDEFEDGLHGCVPVSSTTGYAALCFRLEDETVSMRADDAGQACLQRSAALGAISHARQVEKTKPPSVDRKTALPVWARTLGERPVADH